MAGDAPEAAAEDLAVAGLDVLRFDQPKELPVGPPLERVFLQAGAAGDAPPEQEQRGRPGQPHICPCRREPGVRVGGHAPQREGEQPPVDDKAAPKQLAADVLVDQIVGGLAIRKGIVEAHGGRIRAQSDGPGRGSRFTFTVSVAEEASRHVSPAGPVRSSKTEAERVRVLAVDDDPQMLPYIRDALTEAGYQPIATGDPEEALRLILKEKPQLALLDLMLPGTDGIELMKKIQDTAEVPVIFLSAYGQDQTIAQAIDAGADDYIVKPFSPTELAARIRAALRKRETPEPTEPYTLGELTIDYTQRSVTLAGRPVPLTAIEYRTLVELPTNPGRVLTYKHLLLTGLGPRTHQRLASHAHRHQQPPTQTPRQQQQPHLHPHRTPRRLPHAPWRPTRTEETARNPLNRHPLLAHLPHSRPVNTRDSAKWKRGGRPGHAAAGRQQTA